MAEPPIVRVRPAVGKATLTWRPSSVYRYFGTKEQLVLHDELDLRLLHTSASWRRSRELLGEALDSARRPTGLRVSCSSGCS
jgi:hypothetical protein